MSLANLVKTNQIKPHHASPTESGQLLHTASRNLADSRVENISDETRFDTAYKAIMQCALIGLLANGYRPATSTPGHHQTMIQCLPLTLDVSNDGWLVLDALRKTNVVSGEAGGITNDYLGDLIERESMFECIRQADSLLARTRKWPAEHRPDLMDGGKRP